jgi:hypothetical protein
LREAGRVRVVGNPSPTNQAGRDIHYIMNLKSKNLITISSLALALGLVAGCEKKSESPATTTKDAPKTASEVGAALQKTASDVSTEVKKVAGDVATEATKIAAAVKTTAEKTVNEATKQAEATAGTATAKAQEYIDKAKALVTDRKYQDALNSLQSLSGLTLSAEQQKLVDDLKKTIQTALGTKAATDGASAAGDLLKK